MSCLLSYRIVSYRIALHTEVKRRYDFSRFEHVPLIVSESQSMSSP